MELKEISRIKLNGIKKVCTATKRLRGGYSPLYMQLNVDNGNGHIWVDEFYDYGRGTFLVYHDENIVVCGNISSPMTMDEIRKYVIEALCFE